MDDKRTAEWYNKQLQGLFLQIKNQPNMVDTHYVLHRLNDIMSELSKPGRDPREKFEIFSFEEGINRIEDLKVGMNLPGIVTNITNFGAFVDIGVHQEGLVHKSELADKFVKNPTDIVKLHQRVSVAVLNVDLPRKRIALSMKSTQST